MRTYEAMFLIDNTKASDWDSAVQHVHDILKKGGAQVISTDKWGERKLAYHVNGHRRGTYMQIYFDAATDAIPDMRRDCLLSDAILRTLILKAHKRPETGAEGPVAAPSSFETNEPTSETKKETKTKKPDI